MTTIWRFGPVTDGDGTMKAKLGGKGAGLAKMAKIGVPVPPGFTIPVDFCLEFQKDPAVVEKIWPDVLSGLTQLKEQFGYMPLLSVRSGAPVSMPGMMDTILNVGLTSANLDEWAERIGRRAALDSRRRLIQMLASVALGYPMKQFTEALEQVKAKAGVEFDKDLTVENLERLIGRFLEMVPEFPDTLSGQVKACIKAVFASWENDRARTYREMNKIPHDMGTAVTVQSMVFGNFNDDSGSGVCFTRNPTTGENKLFGEFLPNAQGEDVVAGIRTPLQIDEMAKLWPEVTAELIAICNTLEKSEQDMQDIEFTVQDKKLFLLQCRSGKRTGYAAVRIAVEMMDEGLLTEKRALERVKALDVMRARQPVIAPGFKTPATGEGIGACTGIVSGYPVFTAEEAIAAKVPVILVRHETDPNDIGGMAKAAGVLTATGGATSHAAVVARAMDKPCVTGATGLHVDAGAASLNGISITKSTKITIDGLTGRIWIGTEVPVVDGADDPFVKRLLRMVLSDSGKLLKATAVDDVPLQGVETVVFALADMIGQPERFARLRQELPKLKDLSVVLDFRVPKTDAVDEVLWTLWGDVSTQLGNELLAMQIALEGQIGTSGMTDVWRIGGASSSVLKPIVEVKSLDDLLSADGLVVWDDDKVGTAVGGPKVLAKLMTVLEKAGIQPKPMPPAVYADQAVFARLG